MSTHEILLHVSGLRKSYREGERRRAVIDALDLTVARGERVALLGPSGCGKSSLLNLIGGIGRPDAGHIEIDGRDLTRLSETARTRLRRHDIGFVYQFFNLIPTLTVLENLCLPLELNGRDATAARDDAIDWLRRVNLPAREHAFPDRLSGGEQQRVAVARALIHRPRLVLADEPTGNLDVDNGERILKLLHEVTGEAGAAMVLVTHSTRLADTADRVLRMMDGRLTAVAEGAV